MHFYKTAIILTLSLLLSSDAFAFEKENTTKKNTTLEVLFIGNSYTARHNLADVVQSLAEEGQPGLKFNYTKVIYGGRRLVDHWRLGTKSYVDRYKITAEEEAAVVADLEAQVKKDPKDKYAKLALRNHKSLLKQLKTSPETFPRKKFDIIVLQSYRDDLNGDESLYYQYVPRYVKLAKAQGARVVLYVTTPKTQNAKALTSPPDVAPVIKKTHATAKLANSEGVKVAPMALAVLRCQEQRPDMTHRFINDAHLNQRLSYMTACTLYAAIFDSSPVGLKLNSVTDIRYFENKKENKDRDRDGKPITMTFNDSDRAFLQRIVWETYQEFETLRKDK